LVTDRYLSVRRSVCDYRSVAHAFINWHCYTPVTVPVHSSKDLGALLRQRRKELRLSQEQVASIAGVNRRVLGELERGKGSVQLQIALEVARVLGMDVELPPR
jgi:DNA-binding XRE family transcriptional regulator